MKSQIPYKIQEQTKRVRADTHVLITLLKLSPDTEIAKSIRGVLQNSVAELDALIQRGDASG